MEFDSVIRRQRAELAVNEATKILKKFDEDNTEPAIAFAILGNAFTRLAFGLGHTRKTFKSLCNEMINISDLPKD
jgi:hypothetical protein